MEDTTIQLTNPLLYDKINLLTIEYSISANLLVNLAVKRFLDDVDMIRKLRTGEIKLE